MTYTTANMEDLKDSTNPDPDGIGAKLDSHFISKQSEATTKWGKKNGPLLVEITALLLQRLSAMNATREQVRFIQDWIDEVGEIMRPPTPDEDETPRRF